MLSFKEFLLEQDMLLEDRIDFLTNQYKNKPLPTHDDLGEHKSAGDIINHFAKHAVPDQSYLPHAVKSYYAGKVRQEDHPRMMDSYSNFHKYKGKLAEKDINKYPDLDAVDKAVEPHLGAAASNKEEKRQVKDSGSTLIHAENGVHVRRLDTEEAAKHYGAGTKWCTASKENNMFKKYSEHGPLYFIKGRDESGELKKYQYHPFTRQFMDERDEPVNMRGFVKRNPEIKKAGEIQGTHTSLPITSDEAKKRIHHITSNFENPVNMDHLAKLVIGNKLKPNDITTLMNHPNHEVRQETILSKNANASHIDKALNDEHEYVRSAAAGHPKRNSDHITKALNDPSNIVRQSAVHVHHALTAEHIDKALNDEDEYVRSHSLWNEWSRSTPSCVNSSHINKALKDPSYTVRKFAAHAKEYIDSKSTESK